MPRQRRERRLGPRPEGHPTYIVEKDAPEWRPPEPWYGRWTRKAFTRSPHVYDAYPDRDPLENAGLQKPAPPKFSIREPRRRQRTHLVVVRAGVEREVLLHGAGLEQIDLSTRLCQAMLATEVQKVLEEMDEMEDQELRRGQGLTEYALILALIVIVAIVVVAFLGQQIVQVFEQVGDSIPAP